jgi:hypothetical protein
MEEINSTSLQIKLIRQIQIDEGHTPCYATKHNDSCTSEDCCWIHDCYPEPTDFKQGDGQMTNCRQS